MATRDATIAEVWFWSVVEPPNEIRIYLMKVPVPLFMFGGRTSIHIDIGNNMGFGFNMHIPDDAKNEAIMRACWCARWMYDKYRNADDNVDISKVALKVHTASKRLYKLVEMRIRDICAERFVL